MRATFLLMILATCCLMEIANSQPGLTHGSKVRQVISSTHPEGHTHHVWPPVALPGILKEFDSARIDPRGKRMFLTELKSLEHRLPRLKNEIIRKRRSPFHPKQMSPLPSFTVKRNKRDLRRLRRDLGYDNDYPIAQYPREKRMYGDGPAMPSYRASPAAQMELDAILQGVNLLDRLALLKQARGFTARPFNDQHWGHQPIASRFAPQPLLFPDESTSNPARLQPVFQNMNGHLPRDKIMWTPDKRSSAINLRNSLSMVPGFKRSSFREAERMNQGGKAAFIPENVMSLATILGAERDSNDLNIRRAAM